MKSENLNLMALLKHTCESKGLNVMALFKNGDIELGRKAEKIIKNYLEGKYSVVEDFTFPKELTDEITRLSEEGSNIQILIKELCGTKFDFLVSNGPSTKAKVIGAKGKRTSEWINWGCGYQVAQYDDFAEIAQAVPFDIIIWIKDENQLYQHNVNPEPKYSIVTSWLGKAYNIPDEEIKPIKYKIQLKVE